MAFSPDGKQVVSGSWDKSVKLWNVETGTCESTVRGHNGKDGCICDCHSWGALKGSVNPECPVTGHSGQVSSVAFSADGQWVMSGSSDKKIRLWDTHAVAQ